MKLYFIIQFFILIHVTLSVQDQTIRIALLGFWPDEVTVFTPTVLMSNVINRVWQVDFIVASLPVVEVLARGGIQVTTALQMARQRQRRRFRVPEGDDVFLRCTPGESTFHMLHGCV